MKRKDRFLTLDELKLISQALCKGAAVAVVLARTKEGQTFMCGNGPKDQMEEMIQEGLEHVIMGAPEDDPPGEVELVPDPPPEPKVVAPKSRLILP